MTLFFATFATLLALINPLEAMPVYLGLVEGKTGAQRRSIARRSCLYALALMFFFLIFGAVLLRAFGVPLSMARIAGGVILIKLGFSLFSGSSLTAQSGRAPAGAGEDVSFVPLAMPIMFGPGAMATLMGMTSVVKEAHEALIAFAEVSLAIVATMAVTFAALMGAKRVEHRIGPRGVDAATRIVGFFVSGIGVGMSFQGLMEALQPYGIGVAH